MADSIERIAADCAWESHRLRNSGAELADYEAWERIATRLRALSPAGGDLHHAVWSMVRPYIQPAAREKVNAALKEILAASPQQEPGAEGLRDAISASLYELSLVGEGREHDEAVAHIEKRITSGQTLAGAGVEWAEKARQMIVELRDYVVNERDAQVLPRKRAGYQRELDEIDALLAASPQPQDATSAGTTGDALPELPEPEGEMKWTRSAGVCIRPEPGYDADQMREYALADRRAREVGNAPEEDPSS